MDSKQLKILSRRDDNASKVALITGISGQDGTYLTRYLVSQGYAVIGLDKHLTSVSNGHVKVFYSVNIMDFKELSDFLDRFVPNEIYHLASCYGSSEDLIANEAVSFDKMNDIHCVATVNFLEWIKKNQPKTKFFYPASCYIFGNESGSPQNEFSKRDPVGIYGITKNTGQQLCEYYRKQYGLFAYVGILYNHESPLRSSKFVSKKIVEGAVEIKKNKRDKLVLGDLEAKVDWGYAGDYVEAIHNILQHPYPEDFIVSSGESRSIKEFTEEVFTYLGLDWKSYVQIDYKVIGMKKTVRYSGDSKKLYKATGWSTKTSFKELVKIIVDAELQSSK